LILRLPFTPIGSANNTPEALVLVTVRVKNVVADGPVMVWVATPLNVEVPAVGVVNVPPLVKLPAKFKLPVPRVNVPGVPDVERIKLPAMVNVPTPVKSNKPPDVTVKFPVEV